MDVFAHLEKKFMLLIVCSKSIRNLRRLSDDDFTSDFDALLLTNYSSDNPDEQIGYYHFAGHCGKSLISTVLPVFIKT